MSTASPTPAEVTAARVVNAARTGAPLCIPGARDARARRPAGPTSAPTAAAAHGEKVTSTAADAERVEYELAGGGGLTERGLARHRSSIERLREWWRAGA